MSKYWTRTTMFGDGRDPKHTQRGDMLVGPTKDDCRSTGVTWEWRMYRDGRQEKEWWFNGVSYPTDDQALAAYEASRKAKP